MTDEVAKAIALDKLYEEESTDSVIAHDMAIDESEFGSLSVIVNGKGSDFIHFNKVKSVGKPTGIIRTDNVIYIRLSERFIYKDKTSERVLNLYMEYNPDKDQVSYRITKGFAQDEIFVGDYEQLITRLLGEE